jgi:hypothetical protein
LVGSQSCPAGITVDSAGTVYWVNHCSDQLLQLTKGAYFPTLVLSGLDGPYGVGVDAAGNIYFDEYFSGTLSRLPTHSNTPQVLLTGLDYPNYMSVDAVGDLYFITGQVCGDKILRYDATSHAVTTLLVAPQPHDTNHGFGGLFVDPSGNLYYTTCDYLTLNLIPSGSSTPSVLLNTTSRPTGIAVDSTGNVYYALYNSSINELPAGSKSPLLLTTQGSSHLQLTIDAFGNLYYTDYVGGRVWMIPTQSPGIPRSVASTTTTTETGTATITTTLLATSVLSPTAQLTSVSFSTQTVSLSPSTTTITSAASTTLTTTETHTSTNQPPTQTLTTSVKETTTATTILVQYTNSSSLSSAAIVGLILVLCVLAAYIGWSSRKRKNPIAPQQTTDTEAIETVDGMVLKYVSDHNGKISVSVACTDLGIPQERLRESLKRLVEKGLLNK